MIVTEWEQFRALDFARVEKDDAAPGAGRPAQYLPAGGDRAPRLRLSKHWAQRMI